jgi:hypothetical protein
VPHEALSHWSKVIICYELVLTVHSNYEASHTLNRANLAFYNSTEVASP